jgi:hypothetical protein
VEDSAAFVAFARLSELCFGFDFVRAFAGVAT